LGGSLLGTFHQELLDWGDLLSRQKRTRTTCLPPERPGQACRPCAAGAPSPHSPEDLHLAFRVWGPILESRSPGGRAHCLMSEDPRGRCRLARSCAHILGASTTCPGRESPTVEVCRSRAIHLGESGRSPGMGARPGGCTKGAVPGDGVRDGGGTAARGGKPEHKPLSPWPAEWGQQVSGAALWARPQSTAT